MSNKNKLWRVVEENVARVLGLKRVAFSGGVWPNKEDVEDDHDFVCQVKATESKSLSIRKDVINSLVRRGLIQHKVPLFIFHLEQVEFVTGRTWVALPIDEFEKIKEGLKNENQI